MTSPANIPPELRPALACIAAAIVLTGARPGFADGGAAGAGSDGGPPPEPTWASGREVVPSRDRPPREQVPVVACSFTRPVCVHAAASVPPAGVAATLGQAERSLTAFAALGLPPPRSDEGAGGTRAYDIYLLGKDPPETAIDLVARGARFDEASAFSVLSPAGPHAGCFGESDVARSIAQAILLGMDAGLETGTLAMTSSYLASLVAPCSTAELQAVDDFQQNPERELTGGRLDRLDGAFLFPAWLDDAHGNGSPASVITSLIAVSGQRTPPLSWQWKNEPDVFDALRLAARDRKTTIGDLLLEFSIARAFIGDRSDGAHARDVDRFGAMGRVRFEWVIPLSSLPRRLAPLRPISSTGATYLYVDLAGATKDDTLTFIADWELPVPFEWALVKIDHKGTEAGRVRVASVYGATRAERTVVNLAGLAGLVIVGLNVGDIDRSAPFDPDVAPFEPHGFTVTLAK